MRSSKNFEYPQRKDYAGKKQVQRRHIDDAESEVRLEQLTTTLEPAILLVMGGIVVTILLAIYLPIIQSISSGAGAAGHH